MFDRQRCRVDQKITMPPCMVKPGLLFAIFMLGPAKGFSFEARRIIAVKEDQIRGFRNLLPHIRYIRVFLDDLIGTIAQSG